VDCEKLEGSVLNPLFSVKRKSAFAVFGDQVLCAPFGVFCRVIYGPVDWGYHRSVAKQFPEITLCMRDPCSCIPPLGAIAVGKPVSNGRHLGSTTMGLWNEEHLVNAISGIRPNEGGMWAPPGTLPARHEEKWDGTILKYGSAKECVTTHPSSDCIIHTGRLWWPLFYGVLKEYWGFLAGETKYLRLSTSRIVYWDPGFLALNAVLFRLFSGTIWGLTSGRRLAVIRIPFCFRFPFPRSRRVADSRTREFLVFLTFCVW